MSGTSKAPQYCQCNGDWCPCGKSGWQIIKCRKPMSLDHMTEVFDEMWQRMKEEKALSKTH